MKKDIKLTFDNGTVLEVYKGTIVRDVIAEIKDDQIIALRLNGVAVSADHEIIEDADVKPITVTDRIGQKIYVKGLQYVYILAVKELFGSNTEVNIKHSLDKALYTELKLIRQVDRSVVSMIKKKMKEICERDLKFNQISVNRRDAYDYVKSLNETEKMLNYTYMTNETVTMYELDDEYNYFYYIMPPSTKILNRFDLTYLPPNGVVLSFPIDNVVPKYNPTTQVLNAFKNYEEKLADIGIRYVSDVNTAIIDGSIEDLIQVNEILYNKNMEEIAQRLVDNKNLRAIFISGPSSSGKTTTSKKLAMYLKSMGKDTLVISTDDYFKEREDSPRKADGSYEFEIVDALDFDLFQSHLKKLLAGEEVVIPTYNFIMGKKEYKRKPTRLKENQVLVIEGLHAINEKLNSQIPKKNKLKIYISPFTPVRLDRHNHISTTDVRLIRRMVRDYQHRGYSAEMTLTSWMGMRDSEKNYVYPYQREADIVLNTSLAYEIGVLRTYVEPLLYSISKESTYYEEAIRILNFLKYFMAIPSEMVPSTSVLREFIGDSYYE